MNLWQKAEDLRWQICTIEREAGYRQVTPDEYAPEYGRLVDELSELQIIIWEAECNE